MAVLLRDLPDDQRPRERLIALGAAALTDAELLAVLLSSGRSGASAIDVAHEVLREFGGVAGLAAARPEELSRVCGVGPAKATRLIAASGLAMRVNNGSTDRTAVRTSAELAGIVVPRLVRERVERLHVVVLDAGHRVLRVELVAQGAVDRAPLPVREVLACVLRHDGRALAIAHNHPGGTTEPSAADVVATQGLREAASQVGLRLVDHLIVAGNAWASVMRSG